MLALLAENCVEFLLKKIVFMIKVVVFE